MDQDASHIQKIVSLLKQGEKRDNNLQIGLEIEHIILEKDSLRTIDYYEAYGIEYLLNQMKGKGYEGIYEETHLIGLKHSDYIITLEPGGQIEISLIAKEKLTDLYNAYWHFLQHISPILEKENMLIMCIGYNPTSRIDELPFNPKKRYRHMSEYFSQTGHLSHHMMKHTASIQIVIDYRNEDDFIKKFRVAHYLSPFLALLSDNSPYCQKKPVEQYSLRTAIWDNTDSERCGIIPGVMNKAFSYEDYASYILETPPILVNRYGEFMSTGKIRTKDIQDFLEYEDAEVDHLLSMVFPDVRVRRYIEIRMADSVPLPLSLGLAALIKNLFYNDNNLDELYRLSLNMTDDELCELRKKMQQEGFEATYDGKTCQEILETLLAKAKENADEIEKRWIESFDDFVSRRTTPAMHSRNLVDKFGFHALSWCAAHNWQQEEL